MIINIGIVDDHTVVITGLINMLSAFDHVKIGRVYNSGKDLLEGLKKELPDILLMDIQIPDISGRDLTETISNMYPQVKILAMTGFNDPHYVKTMMDKGASGYLLKNTDTTTLLQAIETIYKGGQFIDPSLSNRLMWTLLQDRKNEHTKPRLTRKEIEVLKLLVDGNSSKEIAAKLFISTRTVDGHRISLLHKFDVKNTATLIKQALKLRVLDDQ